VVVVATGSTPWRPPVPGANGPAVATAREVLTGSAPVGDRVVVVDERWVAFVRGLDWLARFRVEPGSRLELVDRDSTVLRGQPALLYLLSRLPLTAWFALPTLLLPSVRRARRT